MNDLTPHQKKRCTELHQQGYTLRKIADQVGITFEDVRLALGRPPRKIPLEDTIPDEERIVRRAIRDLRLSGCSPDVIRANFGDLMKDDML